MYLFHLIIIIVKLFSLFWDPMVIALQSRLSGPVRALAAGK